MAGQRWRDRDDGHRLPPLWSCLHDTMSTGELRAHLGSSFSYNLRAVVQLTGAQNHASITLQALCRVRMQTQTHCPRLQLPPSDYRELTGNPRCRQKGWVLLPLLLGDSLQTVKRARIWQGLLGAGQPQVVLAQLDLRGVSFP